MNPFIQQLLNTARNTAGKAFRSFDVQALRNMGPAVRRSTGLSAYSTGPITAAVKKDPSFLRALPSAALALPGVKTSLGTAVALETANTANRTGLTGAIEGGLNQVGPGLDRFFGAVIPKPVQDFGNSMQQLGWGALGGFVPGETNAASIPLSGSTPSLRNYGSGYKEKELAAGAAAERFRPGAGFPGQQAAADRSYQQELSRTAQLTAQDPELQRYEKARAGVKTQEEMNSARDIGMEMWQKKYGQTPMGQPGGAIGSFNPLMQRTFGYQTGMSPGDIAQTITNPAAISVGPGEAPYQMGDLGTRATAETGYDPAVYGLSPEMIKVYQEQLLKQAGTK
jgi:hypothetical protein